MKRLILAAILLATAGCGGDPATRVIDGLEASYSKEGRLDAITINFDNDGNARLWAGKRRGIILRDGQDYLMNERRVAIDKTKYKMEPVARRGGAGAGVVSPAALRPEFSRRSTAAAGDGTRPQHAAR